MTLGNIISQAVAKQEKTIGSVADHGQLSVAILFEVLEDKMYPNSIPIKCLQRILENLFIPFETAEPAIIETYKVMDVRKDKGEHKPGNWAGLWENPEALQKYINRLRELMNETTAP